KVVPFHQVADRADEDRFQTTLDIANLVEAILPKRGRCRGHILNLPTDAKRIWQADNAGEARPFRALAVEALRLWRPLIENPTRVAGKEVRGRRALGDAQQGCLGAPRNRPS